MSKLGDQFRDSQSQFDVFVSDLDTDPNYRYYGWAPRADATSPSLPNIAARTAAAFWYIERESKTDPAFTERASVLYDKVWDDRATYTYV